MDEASSPDLPGGVTEALGLLRHALADPLSTAGMKLELLGRRLAGVSHDDSSLDEWVRGAKADLAVAGRLIDLLPRLATITGEAPSETSIDELCRAAGVSLEGAASPLPDLLLRGRATIDAIRAVAGHLSPLGFRPGGFRAWMAAAPGQVTLRIEAVGPSGEPLEGNPERLFQLPRGVDRAEELFLARAAIESDGGRLRLDSRNGRLTALLSWPRLARPGKAAEPE